MGMPTETAQRLRSSLCLLKKQLMAGEGRTSFIVRNMVVMKFVILSLRISFLDVLSFTKS